MAGFDNDIIYGTNADFSNALSGTGASTTGELLTNAQLWIGSTVVNAGGTHINVGSITSPGGTLTVGYSSPNITLDVAASGTVVENFVMQTGTSPVVPLLGQVTFNGATVAAGTNPVRTDGTGANTMTLEVQRSQALSATDATKIGLANFDSAAFDVDANGFVQLNGGGIAATSFDIQANTAPGTDPVVPTTAGVVTVNGAAVANHSVVLETRSRAANAYNLEIQYATSAAATDATKSGVAHFNSTQFSVDASGFVALSGGGQAIDSIGTQTGTNPIIPTAAGLVTINGVTVAAGTNPVRSDGTGANTMAIEVQISQAIASTDATKIGLSNFNSTQFTVDANGFVSFSGTGSTQTLTGNSGTATPVANNINVVTSNTTVKFVGSGSTLTEDFGLSNLILGSSASSITSATHNVGLGNFSLNALSTGTQNTAVGDQAAPLLSSGTNNALFGTSAGNFISTSSNNTALGSLSLVTFTTGAASAGSNTAVGFNSLHGLSTGINNICLGAQSGTNYTSSESSNIAIGNIGTALESNVIRIGTQGSGTAQQNQCFISGIVGVTNSNPQMVSINSSTGQLGVIASTTLFWQVITADQTAAVNNGYICNKASALLLTLPATAVVGDIIRVTGINTALGWKIVQNANQQIFFGNSSTTLGATGFLQSAATRDSIEMVCVVAGASTVYNVISSVGNITIA